MFVQCNLFENRLSKVIQLLQSWHELFRTNSRYTHFFSLRPSIFTGSVRFVPSRISADPGVPASKIGLSGLPLFRCCNRWGMVFSVFVRFSICCASYQRDTSTVIQRHMLRLLCAGLKRTCDSGSMTAAPEADLSDLFADEDGGEGLPPLRSWFETLRINFIGPLRPVIVCWPYSGAFSMVSAYDRAAMIAHCSSDIDVETFWRGPLYETN